MRLASFRHKGLRLFYANDDPRALPPQLADKLRRLLFAIETARTLEQVGLFPGWKLHRLKGDRKGFCSLTVSGNWRLIFRHDEQANTASDIDLVDYH